MLFTFMACISNMSLLHLVCQAILFIVTFFVLKMKRVYYLYMFKLLFSEYFLLASHLIAMTDECCRCYSSHYINRRNTRSTQRETVTCPFHTAHQ